MPPLVICSEQKCWEFADKFPLIKFCDIALFMAIWGKGRSRFARSQVYNIFIGFFLFFRNMSERLIYYSLFILFSTLIRHNRMFLISWRMKIKEKKLKNYFNLLLRSHFINKYFIYDEAFVAVHCPDTHLLATQTVLFHFYNHCFVITFAAKPNQWHRILFLLFALKMFFHL